MPKEYNSEEIFERGKKLIKEHKLLFVEDIVAYLGISKQTLYKHIPVDTNEMDILKSLLNENRVSQKTKIRKKWSDSDNPTAQMALYKLCSTPEEHKKLQQNYTDVTSKDKSINEVNVNFNE